MSEVNNERVEIVGEAVGRGGVTVVVGLVDQALEALLGVVASGQRRATPGAGRQNQLGAVADVVMERTPALGSGTVEMDASAGDGCVVDRTSVRRSTGRGPRLSPDD